MGPFSLHCFLPSFVQVEVCLPPWIYPCSAVESLLASLTNFIKKHPKSVFLIDRVVLEQIQQSFSVLSQFLKGQVVIAPESGEALKTKEVYWQVLEALEKKELRKEDALILIGGGSLLDLGGFVASTYLRGLSYYSVPTTLLASVDAAIGGKTGLNLGSSKNRVGSLYRPLGMILYYPFLSTLPLREKVSGFAEVIKYGLLGDKGFFEALFEKNLSEAFQPEFLKKIIAHCIGMKLATIDQDYKETKGSRWLLNLGHTFGHAIEAVSPYSRYSHGEAVAIGLRGAALFSASLGYLKREDLYKVEHILLSYGLPLALYEPLPIAALLEAMQKDKKASQSCLRLILLRSIGEAFVYELENPEALIPIWLHLGGV